MTAPPVAAPFLAATVVLGAAGLAKLWRPADTARALHAAGWRIGWGTVRLGALAEVVVCAAALTAPGAVTGALVSVSYAGFAMFVITAVWRGWPLSSCGCFGRPDSEPGHHHAALDLGACAAAGWWAASAPRDLGSLFVHQPWHGLPLALMSLVIAGLACLVWTNPLAREVA
ncbi:MAG: hypothetical protein JO337_11095 [Acidimicrobiales bacterium]|nr:hypothetical protein [Acidimicrobiales bacterium]